jgi:ABC-type glycerol-3-phosphate transport system substrate-binding protein
VKLKSMAALGLAGALAFGACGDDDDSSSEEDTAATTAAESEGTEAPSGEAATLRLWLNGPDIPDEVVQSAIDEFESTHPNVTVELERQQWDGLVERLTTALSSDDSPDVVELGNTQAQSFEAAGAFVDLTEHKEALGGDDLVQSLVESGTYDGKFYAAPLLGGARIVVYRKDLFEKSGIEIPTTIDEFIQAGIKLKADNASTPNFSGIYFPGRNWHATLSFIWENGGDIAVQEGDEWVGKLSTPESVAGLEQVQQIMTEANGAPPDSDDANDFITFCRGEVGMLLGPGWKAGEIAGECPEMEANLGAFALPGTEAGTTAPVFLGGSNIGVSANSDNPDLAVELLAVITGENFQSQLAELGILPVRTSLLDLVGGDEAKDAQAAAAQNSRFVPSSENWAAVEGANILQDMGVAIAQGADVATEAQAAEEAILGHLNG